MTACIKAVNSCFQPLNLTTAYHPSKLLTVCISCQSCQQLVTEMEIKGSKWGPQRPQKLITNLSKPVNLVNMQMSFSEWIFTNRVDNSFKEALAAKVREVEHSIVRETFVNWKRVPTGFTTKWRESEIDLHILLRTFLFDRFLQVKLMWPSTSNNEDNSVVGHFVQGNVKAWAESMISSWTIYP